MFDAKIFEEWNRAYRIKYDGILCSHDFVDTGTLKSFCRHCDCNAVWNREFAKYVPE